MRIVIEHDVHISEDFNDVLEVGTISQLVKDDIHSNIDELLSSALIQITDACLDIDLVDIEVEL